MILALSSIFLSGCGFLKKEKPTFNFPTPEIPLSQQPYEFEVTITGSENLNPDPQGRPSPVRMRIFLTEPQTGIVQLPFEQVFEFSSVPPPVEPAATLVIQPGATESIVITGMKTHSNLTVAGAFRDPFSVQWVSAKQLDTDKAVNVAATVSPLGVVIK